MDDGTVDVEGAGLKMRSSSTSRLLLSFFVLFHHVFINLSSKQIWMYCSTVCLIEKTKPGADIFGIGIGLKAMS